MFSKPKIYKCVECGVHDHFMDNSTASDANWNQGLITGRWFCPKCKDKKPYLDEPETIHCHLNYIPQSRTVDRADYKHLYSRKVGELVSAEQSRDSWKKKYEDMYTIHRPAEQAEAEVCELRNERAKMYPQLAEEQARSADMKKQRDDFEAVMNYQATELKEHAENRGNLEDALEKEKRMRQVANDAAKRLKKELEDNKVRRCHMENQDQDTAELKETIEKMNRDYKYLMGIEAKKCLKISDLKREKDAVEKNNEVLCFDNEGYVSENRKLSDELKHVKELLSDSQQDERYAYLAQVKAEKESKEWEDTVNLITREFNKAEQDNAELEKELSGCKAENRGLRETLEIYNVKPGTNGSVEQVTESFKSWRYHNTPAGSINRLVCSDQEFTSTQGFKDYEFAMGLLRRCKSVEVID